MAPTRPLDSLMHPRPKAAARRAGYVLPALCAALLVALPSCSGGRPSRGSTTAAESARILPVGTERSSYQAEIENRLRALDYDIERLREDLDRRPELAPERIGRVRDFEQRREEARRQLWCLDELSGSPWYRGSSSLESFLAELESDVRDMKI
jgi:hypothetical protein